MFGRSSHSSLLRGDIFEFHGLSKRSSAPKLVCIFAVGIAVGFAVSSLLVTYQVEQNVFLNFRAVIPSSANGSEAGKEMKCPSQKPASLQSLQHNIDLNSSFTREILRKSAELQARRLADEVRVLCWVMTNPNNHKSKAFHVKATWGRHCNKLIFISDQEDADLPALAPQGVIAGRDGLWSKTVAAFLHIEENFRNEYDWVMKADDDTYVYVENLRSMLMPYSSGEPIYFGFHFKPQTPQGYMSGGAGYVLSKEAVQRFAHQLRNGHTDFCHSASDGGAEDINIALCLHSLGVKPGDSRDSLGRGRFFPFDIEAHLDPDGPPKDFWFWDYIYWPVAGHGLDCCSDEPISFHYLTPSKMYMLEYLAYHVTPISVMNLHKATKPVKSATESTIADELVTKPDETHQDEPN